MRSVNDLMVGWIYVACSLLATGAVSTNCWALPLDQQNGLAPEKEERAGGLGLHLLKDMAEDQKAMWTSPKRLRLIDADWLLPLGIAAGGMFATDTDYTRHLSNSPIRLKYSRDISNYGMGSIAGIGGGLYLWGQMTHDDLKSKTGILAGEAAINSFTTVYALKQAFGRERPLRNNYGGQFWRGGDSFPSEHAAAAWSIASVIAHEYPGPLTSFFVYGLASAVSASRITAKQHFPSDVLIGSAIGWFAGQQVYRRHHDPTLGGSEWETYAERYDENSEGNPKSIGSSYVQLDSWVYPALERLAALGYIKSEFLGMRPWTRAECAQLVDETSDRIRVLAVGSSDVNRLQDALSKEFQADLDAPVGGTERILHVESLYSSATGITGPPLNDSQHFGQTIINNFGRPYQRGFNSVEGFSGWGTAGRFTIYLRGENQHSGSGPGYSGSVRNLIAGLDGTPVQPAAFVAAVNQFRLLDTYIAANVSGWDLAFGKQSLWWGPAKGSALLFSDNAEPIYMFRASRIAPFTLPWIFHWLGPMKWDLFFGKLSGNVFPPRPLLHREKISFKPTENLELGFSRTVELGGRGRALTLGHLASSYFSVTSPVNETPNTDPGKRMGGFDLSYRVPFVRNWLTVYIDSLADDDPSPLAAPRRAAINPGVYLARFPGIPKLDLRVEAVNTNTRASGPGGHYIYFDSFYRQLYTNKNNLIGSWIGREGQGLQAWSTYWFSPRTTLQFGYRHAKVASDFIPYGETLNDGSVTANWWVRGDLSFSALVQYEKWFAPVLALAPRSDWTSSIRISFEPRGFNLPMRSARRQRTPEQASLDDRE
jgi:membrane-associated phospholipid phosphatase